MVMAENVVEIHGSGIVPWNECRRGEADFDDMRKAAFHNGCQL